MSRRRGATRTPALLGVILTVSVVVALAASCSGSVTTPTAGATTSVPRPDGSTPGAGSVVTRASARCTQAEADAPPDTPGSAQRWAWLAGTTWYVPTPWLPALRSDPATGQSGPVQDQTAYTIDRYADGYFTGKTVVHSTPSEQPPTVLLRNLAASVTPQGEIMLTFIPPSPTGSARTTVGIGTFRCLDGRWSMQMQMSTGSTSTLNHWAYMANCERGDPCNDQVPGTDLTLAAFLAQPATEE